MKLLVTSVLGDPCDARTWSNAPAQMIDALKRLGIEIVPLDSSYLAPIDKALMASANMMKGYPWRAVSWFQSARQKRSKLVVNAARAANCDFILCTGTLDAPIDEQIDYAVWLDNTFSLLQRSATALPYSKAACAEIHKLERAALNAARLVLPFSKYVRDSVIDDYGVPSHRVHVVGCGSGDLPPFLGEKDFSSGHLLFVAKHLFASKGGNLVLDAFELIRAARPGTRLVLIGNDEARARARGIDGVDAYGFVEREVLVRHFHDAAMLVQPMLADPWGQVYLEAMKGRAVIVSLNTAALPELTDGGRLGILVDAPQPRRIADAVLATFARTREDLNQLTYEAQALALERYSWAAVGERVAEALRIARN